MADRPWNSDALAGGAWFRIGNFDVTTSALIPFLGVVSMFVYAIQKSLLIFFIFEPGFVLRGRVWTLLTWPIVNVPALPTVIALYLFYMFGTYIERELGRIGFLKYLLICTVLPAILFTLAFLARTLIDGDKLGFLIGPSLGGVRLLEIALLAVVAIEFPDIRFFFGIPCRVIAAVVIGIDVLQLVGDRDWGSLIFEMVIIFIAIAALKPFGMGKNLPAWVPGVSIPGLSPKQRNAAKRPATARSGGKRAKKGQVVTGPWGETGTATSGTAASPGRAGLNRNDREEVDRLLDKIAASGMGSLSATERQQLEEASKRLRESGQ